MKLLALLLITLNITFFLWQYHSGAFSPGLKITGDAEQFEQQIILVSELDSVSSTRQAQSGLSCVAESGIEESIRNVLFFSKIGEAVAVSAKDEGILLAEWIEFRLIPNGTEQVHTKTPFPATATADEAVVSAEVKPATKEIEVHKEKNDKVIKAGAEKAMTESEPLVKEEAAVPKRNTASVSMCYEAGPFDTMRHFYNWRKQTAIDSASIKPVSRDEQKISDYMVYLPAGETYEQSLANVEMLKQKGITDYWLFPQGEAKGEISLGIFSNATGAEKFKNQLLTKELNASIKPRYKKAQRIYAQIQIQQEYEDKLIISRDRWQKSHPAFAIKVNSSCIFD